MKLERIETPGIAHFAYVLADGGEAAVVDPRRDVEAYLDAARRLGARIRYVVETHRQEDFVMGSAHLAALSGAEIVNGDHELFGHGHRRLGDGEMLALGSLTLRALHTPGHTPESVCYAVFTAGDTERAWGIFTGDTLFFGTTGRTDLTDAGRAAEHAGLLHDAVHGKLAGLGDTALVLPAHGPGSVCGSGMAERPHSTLGEEKRYNEVFTLSREDFAGRKGAERLPRPPYFRHMEQVNLQGGLAPVLRPGQAPLLGVEALAAAGPDARIIDTREPEAFAGGHIPRSLSIWLGGLPVLGGWMADHRSPVYLVTDRVDDLDAAVLHLGRIGIDGVRGGLAGGFGTWRKSGKPLTCADSVTAAELARQGERLQVVDVREDDEFAAGHLPDARHVYVGHLPERIEAAGLDRHRPVVVTCSVGHRASLGVSLLQRAGFADVRNLLGGMTAWRNLGLPVVE